MRKVTEDFIGTCQACFGEYKVNEKSKLIVFHGYKRPGHGYTEGSCVGTDNAPFEYDTALTVRVIAEHRNAAAKAADRKERLESGAITRLVREWSAYDAATRRSVTHTEEIGPNSQYWERTLKARIANCESDHIYHTRVAAYLQQMVDNWKRGAIVGIDTPATGRERALREAYDPVKADALAERQKIIAERAAKPGKLRLLFYYTSKVERTQCSTDDEWRARYDRIEAERLAYLTKVKTWMKGNITGRVTVRQGYDSDLPRAVRNTGDYDVVIVTLPWDYRDEISTMFSSAQPYETEKKKVSFTIGGPPDSH